MPSDEGPNRERRAADERDPVEDRGFVAEVEIGVSEPGLRLRVPAIEDSLPVVRQVLRALADTIAAESEELEDAELALTEACANAVEHAYPDSEGVVEITLFPREHEMLVSVRDFGRGMPPAGHEPPGRRGHGLVMIEGIARAVEISGGDGTEIAMTLHVGEPQPATVDGAAPGLQPTERVIRRLVAVLAAQSDMPVDRTLEALLVTEMATRIAYRRLVGELAKLRVTRWGSSIELRLGPLELYGGEAAVKESEVPAIGSVVERLSDGVRTEREAAGDSEVEYLVLSIRPRVQAPTV